MSSIDKQNHLVVVHIGKELVQTQTDGPILKLMSNDNKPPFSIFFFFGMDVQGGGNQTRGYAFSPVHIATFPVWL